MWVRPYWRTGQVVQHIGQKGCLPSAERSCEGSHGPQKSFSPTFSESTSTSQPGAQCGLGGMGSSSARVFLPSWKLLSPDHNKAAETRANEPPPCFPFNLLPSHAERAPSSPGLGPSPACCWLFCFLGGCCCRAAAPSHGAAGRTGSAGEATTNTRESHSAWSSHCSAPRAKKSLLLATGEVRREMNYRDEWCLRGTCDQAWLGHRGERWK